MAVDLFGIQARRRARELEAALGTERARPPKTRIIQRLVPVRDRGNYQRFDMSAGADNALTHSWTRTPMSAHDVTESNLTPVRARSRREARANEYMVKFLAMVQNGIIGPPGLMLQARIRDANGKIDDGACQAVEDAWERWGDDADYCDYEGRLSWFEHQCLFARTVAMDGEYLARKIVGRDAGPYGFCLQVLDPELLDITLNKNLRNGNRIRLGIEYGARQRPVAYYLITDKLIHERVPAEEMIHCFVALETGQRRGWPWAYASLMSMNMLGGYEEAAVTAARVGASKSFVITTPDGDGPAADAIETGDAEGDNEGTEFIDAAEPGSGWKLGPGEGIQPYDPSYPTGEFDPFTRAILRRIAAGANVSYAALSGDQSQASYSSARQGLIEERDAWMMLQAWAIRQFARPVYRSWLPMALLTEQIQFPNGPASWSADREVKFGQVTWQGRRWQWVDPESDIAAQVTAVEQGLMTRSEVIRERGRDPEEVWLERQREDQRLTELGIKVPVVGQIPGGAKKEIRND